MNTHPELNVGDGTLIGFRVDAQNPAHTRVSVFVGPDRGSRGHAGTLTFRDAEWRAFAAWLHNHNVPEAGDA